LKDRLIFCYFMISVSVSDSNPDPYSECGSSRVKKIQNKGQNEDRSN
jgi:hypothetical protein